MKARIEAIPRRNQAEYLDEWLLLPARDALLEQRLREAVVAR